MLLRPVPLLAFMSLLTLFGCSRGNTELPASLAELQLEIRVTDETERGDDGSVDSRQRISAVVRRVRGGAIERPELQVEVNGVPLELRVATGNYYDRHPSYQLPDSSPLRVTADTTYAFALVLPDGSRHEIGTVRTPAPLTLAQLDFLPRRPATGAITVAWRDLIEPARLTLFRSDMWRDGDTRVLESGSATDPSALHRDLGSGFWRRRSDRWTVPEEYLAVRDGHELRALGVQVLVTHEGAVDRKFAGTSTLRAERRLTLRMEYAPVE